MDSCIKVQIDGAIYRRGRLLLHVFYETCKHRRDLGAGRRAVRTNGVVVISAYYAELYAISERVAFIGGYIVCVLEAELVSRCVFALSFCKTVKHIGKFFARDHIVGAEVFSVIDKLFVIRERNAVAEPFVGGNVRKRIGCSVFGVFRKS